MVESYIFLLFCPLPITPMLLPPPPPLSPPPFFRSTLLYHGPLGPSTFTGSCCLKILTDLDHHNLVIAFLCFTISSYLYFCNLEAS